LVEEIRRLLELVLEEGLDKIENLTDEEIKKLTTN
jgi:hypothetical protein